MPDSAAEERGRESMRAWREKQRELEAGEGESTADRLTGPGEGGGENVRGQPDGNRASPNVVPSEGPEGGGR